jgi:hypothetical protein
MLNVNDLYLDVLFGVFAWTLIVVASLGFIFLCLEAWREHGQQRRRAAWQRMPQIEPKPNVRLHKIL